MVERLSVATHSMALYYPTIRFFKYLIQTLFRSEVISLFEALISIECLY